MRFALVELFVIALMAYVGWHLWTLPPLPAWARWLIVALQALGFAMFCIAMSPLLDRMPMPVASLIYNVGTRSLMVMLYLLMAFLLADLLRLVHLLPAAWLLARLTGSVYAVWWCFPIAEIAALIISIYYYRKCDRELFAPM